MQNQDYILHTQEPGEEELEIYADFIQDQLIAEGKNLRKIIEPLLRHDFFPFEEPCLGSDVLVLYYEKKLPSRLAARIMEHLVCCMICAEDVLFCTITILSDTPQLRLRLFSFAKKGYANIAMIIFLEGTIELKTEKFAVMHVSGIGYRVFFSPDAIQKIPEKGGNVKVWIHHHIREDSQELYGFRHYAELELFEMLIGISGIGPRGALSIMAIAPVDTLKKAIAAGDTSYLIRVSGIGKKTAEKVVLELKDKMAGKGMTIEAPELKDEADAIDALVALGYSQREARDALTNTPRDEMTLEKRVSHALKRLGVQR